MASVVAAWNMASSGGMGDQCAFNVAGRTCQVRGVDGLPVELMDFYIDESGDDEVDPKSNDGTTD